MMPLVPSPSRTSRPAAAIGCGGVVRMILALLVAVALPAQAISASVERAWNAAHYHLDDSDRTDVSVVVIDAVNARPDAIAEHYPLQIARDMASVHRIPAEHALDDTPRRASHDTHADAHRAGIAHHHDAGTRNVVYVADAGEQPMLAAERTGKHDHDGFSPAVPLLRALAAQQHGRDQASLDSTQRVTHVSSPGERPPR